MESDTDLLGLLERLYAPLGNEKENFGLKGDDCRFGKLAPELRNLIYYHASLDSANVIQFEMSSTYLGWQQVSPTKTSTIEQLRWTCRQVYNEVIPFTLTRGPRTLVIDIINTRAFETWYKHTKSRCFRGRIPRYGAGPVDWWNDIDENGLDFQRVEVRVRMNSTTRIPWVLCRAILGGFNWYLDEPDDQLEVDFVFYRPKGTLLAMPEDRVMDKLTRLATGTLYHRAMIRDKVRLGLDGFDTIGANKICESWLGWPHHACEDPGAAPCSHGGGCAYMMSKPPSNKAAGREPMRPFATFEAEKAYRFKHFRQCWYD